MKKQLINIAPIKDVVREKLIEKYNTTTFMNTAKVQLTLDIEDIINEHIATLQLLEPEVYITPEAYLKMRLLVDKTTSEIGWYGIVNQQPGFNNKYVIEDIIVYPQKVSGATCEQDESRMFDFEMGLTTDEVNHKRFQGHSHVNMGVSPSGVDENFYQELLTQVTDYFIITVTNKNNVYHTRFYDMANNILYTDVAIELLSESGTLLSTWYDLQAAQAKKPVRTTTPVKESYTEYYNGEKIVHTTETNKQTALELKQELDEEAATLIYDPYILQYITPKEFEELYKEKYDGRYDKDKPKSTIETKRYDSKPRFKRGSKYGSRW